MLLTSLLVATVLQAPSTRSTPPADLGPAVGRPLPAFEVRDQDGRSRDFASLTGPKGLVLVVFRSADW